MPLPFTPVIEPALEARPLMEITVTASPLGRTADDLTHPLIVMAGEELAAKRRNTLGETLAQEPGISANDFGQGASRPVIRGQAGPRVEVLENGMSAMDVSNLSPDHAVAISPLQASQIEVIKGPATLLYGGSAIGGVVNVVNNRLVTEITPGLTGRLEAARGSVAGEQLSSGEVRYGQGQHQFHADFSTSRADDYRIPGSANADGSGSRGRLANSAAQSENGAVSWNRVDAAGNAVGLSYNQLQSVYGLPIEETAFIDQQQRRLDSQALLRNPFNGVESLRVKASQARYRHTEFEGPGEVGTRFRNDETQLRAELTHAPWAGLRGVMGLQASQRDFAAQGGEAYVPSVKSRQGGIFLVEERRTAFGKLEFGARVEQVQHAPEASGLAMRRFTPASASLGSIVNIGQDSHLKLTASHAERAPAIEEIYASGPHKATGTFELGKADARKEATQEFEIGVDHHTGRLRLEAAVFARQSRNYVFLASADPTSCEAIDPAFAAEGLRCTRYQQRNARFTGYEASATYAVIQRDGFRLDARAFADQVRGTLSGGGADSGAVPRLTPARQGLGLHAHVDRVSMNLQYTHVDGVSRIALAEETPTSRYHLLNADLTWKVPGRWLGSTQTEVFVRGTNLLDDTIRRHTSFIKDSVPASGRGGLVGFRLSF